MTLCTGSVAADKDTPRYKSLLGDGQTTGLCTGKLSFSSCLFPTPLPPQQNPETALLGLGASVAVSAAGVKRDGVGSESSHDGASGRAAGDPGVDGPAEHQPGQGTAAAAAERKGRLWMDCRMRGMVQSGC